MIEATPAPDNEQEHGSGGAFVNCWINYILQDGAEVLARYYIERAGWIPAATHEHRWVEADDYKDEPENLHYYLEAQANGASFVFNSWPADAEDADTDYAEED
jgi:hypothetical protein